MCNRNAVTDRYLAVFTNVLGLPAFADEDGDVVVETHGGWRFTVQNHAPQDPEFLHMIAFFESNWTETALATACTSVNLRVKGAKVMPVSASDYLCTVEFIAAPFGCIPSAEHLAAILPRAIRMMQAALAELREEIAQPNSVSADEPQTI